MSAAAIMSILALVIAGATCLGSLFVMWHQKTVVDTEGHVVDVQVPFFGRMKTNVPAMAGVFLGIVLTAFVMQRWTVPPATVPLSATIKLEQDEAHSGVHRDVFIGVALPEHYRTVAVQPNSEQTVEFPIHRTGTGSQSHFGVAYTVTRIDENGYAHRVVHAGNLRFAEDGRRALFDALLPLTARGTGGAP